MAVGVTFTKPTGVRDGVPGARKSVIRDITLDTGTYVTGGFTVLASSVGLKRIDIVNFGTQVMTNGTAGATGNPIGVTYASGGTSCTFYEYESTAAGTAFGEKTGAEANAANCTFRVEFVGY